MDEHTKECKGEREDEEVKGIKKDNSKILYVLNRSKPEVVRFDVVNKSRIQISVVFTSNPKEAFPNLFQFVFIKGINRMFVVGGSNHSSDKAETWNVLEVIIIFQCIE